MKTVWLLAVAFLGPWAAAAQSNPPAVTRAALSALERQFDEILSRPAQSDAFDLLGNARGVYLEGYGVVLTAELSLVVAPGLSPFRPALTKTDVENVRARKARKLPELKQIMQDMLLAAASKLVNLPADEQVAVAVTLSYYSWEDRSGLPAQVLMQARKKDLIGKTPGASLAASIRQQEY